MMLYATAPAAALLFFFLKKNPKYSYELETLLVTGMRSSNDKCEKQTLCSLSH